MPLVLKFMSPKPTMHILLPAHINCKWIVAAPLSHAYVPC
jgi:hypothetical protein